MTESSSSTNSSVASSHTDEDAALPLLPDRRRSVSSSEELPGQPTASPIPFSVDTDTVLHRPPNVEEERDSSSQVTPSDCPAEGPPCHPSVDEERRNVSEAPTQTLPNEVEHSDDVTKIFEAPALCNLIVNYLPPLMDELALYRLFSQFGPLIRAKIIYDNETGESKGFGFVHFECFFSATFAHSKLNRYEIGGKILKVAYADRVAADKALKAIQAIPPSQQRFTERQKRVFAALRRQQQIAAQLSEKGKKET